MSSTESDGNRQPGLITLCVVMLILAVASVALRCWSIWGSRTHKFGYDDVFAILTLPFIIAESALIFYWISQGLGRHSATLPISNQLEGPKIIFAAAYLYDACITFPKLSVLCFYDRVLRRGGTWVRPTLWVVGTLCVCWLIGSCAILDVIILLIPLPLLWTLQMTKAKKVMLSGLFVCGYSVVIVSLGRLVTLLKAGSALEADLTWSTIEYICWVQCEGPISLIAMSLSASKQTASDLLSGKRSFRPLEEDREAILMDHYSGAPKRHNFNTTTEAMRSDSERDSV
ncbi:hypothetical protein N7474_010674 [Penicillium riverlandense]|uniref:uncharacterized protein n=1 Tax=Penicillium riverlandense TaxID=1903569 RepID=UPI002548632C|nr:uncharacterized protein N7474_010674 [Penicillium riverlandense]KAJ5807082.1 hypothetical protein N7474_010674 [Penicillium riverlandense]